MTPEQITLVQNSFARVAPSSDKAAELFYRRLFEVAPQVRSLFPDDLAEQRRKLMATLALVVNGLGDLETILPAAKALGKRHIGYGAKPAHFPVVGEALLWTLEQGLGASWTPDIAAAWSAAYALLSDVMIGAASSDGRAPGSST
jgi:nitric oxide dioxygenase